MDELDIFKGKLKNIVGFESLIEHLFKNNNIINYPPYNIKKFDNFTCISMALAGFTKKDLSIYLVENQLEIIGKKSETQDNLNSYFVYKGIANRSFKKNFLLEEGMKIKSAILKDGMLEIYVQQPEKPSHKIPIPIYDENDTQLLTTDEDK